MLDVCNQPEYASLPPSQIVPKLADDGTYLASESTVYRILKAEGQLNQRGRARKRRTLGNPQTRLASGPNQVWTWDITFLLSTVRGQFFYLYLVEDIYSRYGVAWEVHERESGEHAAELIHKALLRENALLKPPVLHADSGSRCTKCLWIATAALWRRHEVSNPAREASGMGHCPVLQPSRRE